MNIMGWPFAITVSGDLENGASATITIESNAPLTEELFSAQRYAVESFVALGGAGGLGGDRVAPARSQLVMHSAPIGGPGASAVVWRLDVVAIDARSLIVLFNALALLNRATLRVAVQAAGADGASFSVDDLPPAWPLVPFQEEDDRTSASVELIVTFASPPPTGTGERILEPLQAWLDCGSIQGYRDWSGRAERSFLAPTADPAFEIVGDELTSTLEDSGVLEGCYDILTNVLIKLHDTVAITSLELA